MWKRIVKGRVKMNKKIALYAAVPLLALSLAACNSEDESKKEDTKTEQNDTTNNESSSTDSTTTEESTSTTDVTEQPYRELDLEVKYPTGDYTLEYEKQSNGEVAEVEDERQNTKKTGDEALGELQPLMEKFTFDENTSDEEVKKQIMDHVKIDDDYTSIELNVTFNNGTEKEYKFNK